MNRADPTGLCDSPSITFIHNDDDSWTKVETCLDRFPGADNYLKTTLMDRNPIAMLNAFSHAMDTFGDLSGINDLGQGVDRMAGGNVVGGAVQVVLALPAVPEDRAAWKVIFQNEHAQRHLLEEGLGHLIPGVEAEIEHLILGHVA